MSKQKKTNDKQLAQDTDKNTLGENEFAIQQAASFNFNPAGTVINVNDDDGSISITVNYKLTDATNLQKYDAAVNPCKITFPYCGVFDKTLVNNFNSDGSPNANFILSIASGGQISLKSKNKDLQLTTFAIKGRQGNA